MLTTEQSALLQEWRNTKDLLDFYKEHEAKLRPEVQAALFPNASEGTNTLEIGNGWKLKLVAKTNYKIQNDDGPIIQAIAEQTGAIKFEPKLSISAYKHLSAVHKAMIDEVLTTSPGMPTLMLEEPKV
jgi:hypothetical protein